MPIAVTQWMQVDDLLLAFHPDNPIVHNSDIPNLALSLLEGGWIEPITLNQTNGKLVGGHGRTLAADWLRQQSPEWHDYRWEMWRSEHQERESDRERFDPFYWQQALVLLVNLSEAEHLAMMIRLNDTENQGKDNPQRLQALLSGLPGRLREMAGYETIAPPPSTEPQAASSIDRDIAEKQYFEAPDATDYRVRNAPEPDTAEHFSGEVDEWVEEPEEEEEEEEPKAPPPVRALSISLTWAEWKQWNNWKRGNGIAKDTDAFVAGHEAYEVKADEQEQVSQN